MGSIVSCPFWMAAIIERLESQLRAEATSRRTVGSLQRHQALIEENTAARTDVRVLHLQSSYKRQPQQRTYSRGLGVRSP